MINDNVVELNNVATVTSQLTLDEVINNITQWRANKKNVQEKIPENLWDQILKLVAKFSAATVCGATGISHGQLQRKLTERQSQNSKPEIEFCEAKPMINLYEPEKLLKKKTLIVEFCRADGRIMKIHTTTDSFAELMKAFFSGE